MPSLIKNPTALYKEAWGKQWAQHGGTIIREDVIPAGQPAEGQTTYFNIPERLDYVCLDGMSKIHRALNLTTFVEEPLVVRDEYVKLREAMEGISPKAYHTVGVVVMGQQGIGKTAFLLYLLLHRLENKLPTAVQFGSHSYTIFDDRGAQTVPISKVDRRLDLCWALVDGNADVTQPCQPFRSAPQVVIQATSDELSPSGGWVKQSRGTCVVSDVPNMLEIAAIFKELGFSPQRAFALVNKWGPSTRTILGLAQTRDLSTAEGNLERIARATARYICADSLSSKFSRFKQNLLFTRPYRPSGLTDIASSQLGTFFIPTAHLSRIFDMCCTGLSSEEQLQLFHDLSFRWLTRPTGSWRYEMTMHDRLCIGGDALPIRRADRAGSGLMQPTTDVLPGTTTGLQKAALNSPFYWLPTVESLPGVDGVLGDTKGNIYVVRVTLVGDDYINPLKGLETIWAVVGQTLRDGGHWHFVVVADTAPTVDRYVGKYSDDLRDVTFGTQKVSMEVWGCVFPGK